MGCFSPPAPGSGFLTLPQRNLPLHLLHHSAALSFRLVDFFSVLLFLILLSIRSVAGSKSIEVQKDHPEGSTFFTHLRYCTCRTDTNKTDDSFLPWPRARRPAPLETGRQPFPVAWVSESSRPKRDRTTTARDIRTLGQAQNKDLVILLRRADDASGASQAVALRIHKDAGPSSNGVATADWIPRVPPHPHHQRTATSAAPSASPPPSSQSDLRPPFPFPIGGNASLRPSNI